MVFKSDGKILVSATEDGTLRIWDVVNYRCVKTLLGQVGSKIFSVAVAGDKIVSGSWDRTIRVWDWGGGARDHDGRP